MNDVTSTREEHGPAGPYLGRWRIGLLAFVLVLSLLFPVFDRNAGHFGWGFFPLMVSIGLFFCLAPILLLDAVLTLVGLASRAVTGRRLLVRLVYHSVLLGWWVGVFLAARS